MRIAVKYQLLLAPAAVLFIMTLLLVFLQYTYWDLSVKRQKSKNLAVAFVSLAEADLAAQRMQGLSQVLKRQHQALWKLYVFLSPALSERTAEAGRVCEQVIGLPNELPAEKRGSLL